MKLSKLVAVLALVLGSTGILRAEDITARDLFKKTEGNVIDWAIASSFEPVYYRDMINGRNAVGAQFPIVYVFKYLSADFGYLAAYEGQERGTLAVGGSLRINELIEDSFPNQVALIKSFVPNPGDVWSKLFFGPWIAHQFTNQELSAGIKGGLQF